MEQCSFAKLQEKCKHVEYRTWAERINMNQNISRLLSASLSDWDFTFASFSIFQHISTLTISMEVRLEHVRIISWLWESLSALSTQLFSSHLRSLRSAWAAKQEGSYLEDCSIFPSLTSMFQMVNRYFNRPKVMSPRTKKYARYRRDRCIWES